MPIAIAVALAVTCNSQVTVLPGFTALGEQERPETPFAMDTPWVGVLREGRVTRAVVVGVAIADGNETAEAGLSATTCMVQPWFAVPVAE